MDESSKQQKGNKNSYYEPESDDGQYYESPAPRPAPRPAPQNYAPPRPAPVSYANNITMGYLGKRSFRFKQTFLVFN